MELNDSLFRSLIRRLFSVKIRQKLKAKFALMVGGPNLLGNLSNAYMSDKNSGHSYTQHYQFFLQHLRKKPINLLEIGIGGYDDPNQGGSSLRMWKDFFPKGQINGIDLFFKKGIEENRIRTFYGSQADPEFLKEVLQEIGQPDIIIDDGSHINHLTIKTFELLFPHLKKDGFYIIEDLQTSYWPELMGVKWGGSLDLNSDFTVMGFLKRLTDSVNKSEFIDPDYIDSYYDKSVVGISFFHNICIIRKGDNIEPSNVVGNIKPETRHPQPASKF